MVNQVWGKHATVVTGDQDGSKQVSKNEWNENLNRKGLLGFSAETIASASSVTIPDDSSNDVSSFIKLSGTTSVDTLVTTNTSEGDLLYIITTGSVTLNNTSSPSSAGDIRLLADANKDLSTTVPTILMRISDYWYEYGGGITNSLGDIGNVVITSVGNEDVLAYDSTTSKWINQTADESGRVTASSTTTFSNKSIDLTDNTLTGTSLELKTAISDETGSGALVFATSPTLVTPALGTPASGVLTNCTALPAAQVAQGTMASGMVLVAPALGTPASGVATNLTGTAASLTAGNATLAATVTTNANLTGGVTSVGNAATVVTNANLTGGVTSVGNAATVVTNANLTGDVTSSGNATTIAAGAVDIAMLSATGTASATTFLRGDGSWQTAGGDDTPWTVVHDFDTYYYDMQVQTKPADPSADNGRFYVKEIDTNNDGVFCIIRKNGGFEETQIV